MFVGELLMWICLLLLALHDGLAENPAVCCYVTGSRSCFSQRALHQGWEKDCQICSRSSNTQTGVPTEAAAPDHASTGYPLQRTQTHLHIC